MKKTKSVALYGGSFDPPHFGHIVTINALLNFAKVDEIWLVPSALQMGKECEASTKERKSMLELLVKMYFKNTGRVKIDYSQIKTTRVPSSTFELMSSLRLQYPQVRFYFVIGTDLLSGLSTWHESKRLLRSNDFLVMPRPGFAAKSKLPRNFRLLGDRSLATTNISSSLLRRLLKKRRSIVGLTPSVIVNYIRKRRLYRPN